MVELTEKGDTVPVDFLKVGESCFQTILTFIIRACMQIHEARPILNGFLLVKVCIPFVDFQNLSLKNAYFF